MTDDAMWVPAPSWFELREEGGRRLANLACGLHAAALEELRVRAAVARMLDTPVSPLPVEGAERLSRLFEGMLGGRK